MNDKTRILFELGEAERSDNWPDYLQYGFDESDVNALLELVSSPSLNRADGDSKEVWVPLHAWRTLGQIGSDHAAGPLVAQFDALFDDDWALSELPKVMGMIGEKAIEPLATCLKEAQHDEFARAMAADSLAEIAARQPHCRERVIQCCLAYMDNPDETAPTLNGLLIGNLIDLEAREAIEPIRRLFEKDCVDITCNGDLEEVEIALGLRAGRSTPPPDLARLYDAGDIRRPESDDILGLLDDYLLRYGNDEAILDVSELDGFLAALACAPNFVPPSIWMPAIWGPSTGMPAWDSEAEFTEFSHLVFTLYNHVNACLNAGNYEALFLERKFEDKTCMVVDEWCEGFMRGLSLWEPLSAGDDALLQERLRPIRIFTMAHDQDIRDAMSEEEIVACQQQIEPNVRHLFRHFLSHRGQSHEPYVRHSKKTGRNDPCPCGSGKKYKKCCLH